MHKVLFIGSFLSAKRGSKGIAESLADRLQGPHLELILVSRQENKFRRLFEIILAILFFRGQKIHIDVFSGQAFTIADIASRLAAWRGKQILFTLHGGKLCEFAEKHQARIQQVFQRAQYIQTPSLFLQFYFQQLGFDIQYLPNSVDIALFPFQRNKVKPFSLLWVRGFISIYNPEIAVRVLAEVRKKIPQCTLTMVGPDKGLMQSTKNLAQKLKIDQAITFVGPIANHELKNFYQQHHVFINTTSYESFGVAVVEAALCGIPIVSNSVGEIPYLWTHNVNALLVQDQNIEQYTKSIIQLFEQPEFAEKLAMNALHKALEFDWARIKPAWEKLLLN